MGEITTLINTLWPIVLGFITLVIVLAKMHTSIEVLQEKVKVLFELHNEKEKK
tara:strand:+ start:324 stop:482 length:159 start_codon:yes stop_codon:yes gene_type:complete